MLAIWESAPNTALSISVYLSNTIAACPWRHPIVWVDKLIKILLQLREGGNTVVVIEHNLDVIKTADYIIDLGPEGGSGGGEIVCVGTPEEVAEVQGSYTGQFLKKVLENK